MTATEFGDMPVDFTRADLKFLHRMGIFLKSKPGI